MQYNGKPQITTNLSYFVLTYQL